MEILFTVTHYSMEKKGEGKKPQNFPLRTVPILAGGGSLLGAQPFDCHGNSGPQIIPLPQESHVECLVPASEGTLVPGRAVSWTEQSRGKIGQWWAGTY